MSAPGTGADWRNAPAPEGKRPVGPRSTVVRPWDEIPGTDTPTDAELLAWLDACAAGETSAESARAAIDAAEIRRRAAAGYHDGSLPELGDYRPVYFVPEDAPQGYRCPGCGGPVVLQLTPVRGRQPAVCTACGAPCHVTLAEWRREDAS